MRFPTQKRGNDCLRACIAGILDLPIDSLPDPDASGTVEKFWLDWEAGLERRGFNLNYHNGCIDPITDKKAVPDLPTEGPWIAIVPSFGRRGCSHAVIMEDKKFVHDPSRGNKRKRVRKVWFGITVEPIIEIVT